ncbi:TPA: hypothetical protein ACGO2Q_002368 [Streptococcus suis]
MKELLLTDTEAQKLIKILKVVAQKHNKTLHNQTNGKIDIVGKGDKRFILNYFYSTNSKVFHLRETEHNYTLLSDLLGFTNVSNPEEININIQEDLL